MRFSYRSAVLAGAFLLPASVATANFDNGGQFTRPVALTVCDSGPNEGRACEIDSYCAPGSCILDSIIVGSRDECVYSFDPKEATNCTCSGSPCDVGDLGSVCDWCDDRGCMQQCTATKTTGCFNPSTTVGPDTLPVGQTGRLRWVRQAGKDIIGDPVMSTCDESAAGVDQTCAYLGATDNYFYAVRAGSGQCFWKHDAGGSAESGAAALSVDVDGKIYVGSLSGKVHAFRNPVRSSSEFAAHWSCRADDTSHGSGALGSCTSWEYDAGSPIKFTPILVRENAAFGDPAEFADQIIVGTDGGGLHFIEESCGAGPCSIAPMFGPVDHPFLDGEDFRIGGAQAFSVHPVTDNKQYTKEAYVTLRGPSQNHTIIKLDWDTQAAGILSCFGSDNPSASADLSFCGKDRPTDLAYQFARSTLILSGDGQTVYQGTRETTQTVYALDAGDVSDMKWGWRMGDNVTPTGAVVSDPIGHDSGADPAFYIGVTDPDPGFSSLVTVDASTDLQSLVKGAHLRCTEGPTETVCYADPDFSVNPNGDEVDLDCFLGIRGDPNSDMSSCPASVTGVSLPDTPRDRLAVCRRWCNGVGTAGRTYRSTPLVYAPTSTVYIGEERSPRIFRAFDTVDGSVKWEFDTTSAAQCAPTVPTTMQLTGECDISECSQTITLFPYPLTTTFVNQPTGSVWFAVKTPGVASYVRSGEDPADLEIGAMNCGPLYGNPDATVCWKNFTGLALGDHDLSFNVGTPGIPGCGASGGFTMNYDPSNTPS